jgi:hypothetical protein
VPVAAERKERRVDEVHVDTLLRPRRVGDVEPADDATAARERGIALEEKFIS